MSDDLTKAPQQFQPTTGDPTTVDPTAVDPTAVDPTAVDPASAETTNTQVNPVTDPGLPTMVDLESLAADLDEIDQTLADLDQQPI